MEEDVKIIEKIMRRKDESGGEVEDVWCGGGMNE